MIPGSTKGHLEAWRDSVTISASEEVRCRHHWATRVRRERGVRGDIQAGHLGRGVLPAGSWLSVKGRRSEEVGWWGGVVMVEGVRRVELSWRTQHSA